MTNTLEAIHLLEKTLKNLLSNYEFLKRENHILLQSNTELQHKLLETAQNLVNQKKEFDILKIAKTIQGSSSDTKNTKLKNSYYLLQIS